jgi:hypothetical protein
MFTTITLDAKSKYETWYSVRTGTAETEKGKNIKV